MGNQNANGRRKSLEAVIENSRCWKPLKIEWNTARHGRCIRFDGKREIKGYGSWGVCTPSASITISAERCIEYEFEIKILSDSHGRGSAVMMGFIDHSELNGTTTCNLNGNLSDIGNEKRFVFQIGDGQKGLIQINGQNAMSSDCKRSIKLNHDFDDDDTFRVRVNYKRKDIELFYNGKSVGVLFESIPSKMQLIPCVALRNATVHLMASNIIEV